MGNIRLVRDVQLGARARTCRRVINPRTSVSSLPNEVLSAVFEAALVSSQSNRSWPHIELLVTRVARRWRDVALSTPQLWTYVYIPWGAKGRAKAEVYLSRSGALPLDLFLDIDENNDSSHAISHLANVINCHAARWRSLRIDSVTVGEAGEWVCGAYALLTLLPSSVPLLEHIQLTIEEVYQREFRGHYPLDIYRAGAPSLTRIRIRGFGMHLCLPPSATVTRLELHEARDAIRFSSAKLASMLAGLSALKFLVINGDFIEEWVPATHITMPSLQHFYVRAYRVEQIPAFLGMISAPLLQSLLLDSMWGEDEFKDFGRFVDLRPGLSNYPRLRSLTIMADYLSTQSWATIASLYPTVTHITLLCNDFNSFFGSLHRDQRSVTSTVSRWPELHSLTLIDRPSKTPTLLRDTLASRISFGQPIQKLYLSSCLMTQLSDDLGWIRENVDVEETRLYTGLQMDSPFIGWADD